MSAIGSSLIPRAFADRRREQPVPFFFTTEDRSRFLRLFLKWDRTTNGPTERAEAINEGRFRFFEHVDINMGLPPDWHLNPVTGERFPVDRHWTEISDFSGGDIKLVWEASRFAWVYPLVRAYWRTGGEAYPRLFWELLEDWRDANPPQWGVNWKCGQEVALRVMACCFGLYGFADSPETTPQRLASLTELMAVSANRIEANLSYALSQRNNHGLTEANGLWTVGLLFPELASSERWAALGRDALRQQIDTLIDNDGAFSQHSVNYQRVMLETCAWAIRLGDQHARSLGAESTERVARAGRFLWLLQDDITGQVPRYGQNDGALVLPLSNCDSADYRPAIQLTAMLNGNRRYERGPWDETALWLLGTDSLTCEDDKASRADWHAPDGGYQVLRSDSGHVMTRAPCYRHRPAHADALHVDLWWRGRNIALDAGTYSYNAPPPWNNPLAETFVHNTVSVDGHNQMDRAGRFLWLPWLSGQRTAYATSPCGQLAYWEGTHDGYRRLASPVSHRRGILRIGGEHWLVLDVLESLTDHEYRLHWLLEDAPYLIDEIRQRLTLITDLGDYHVQLACSAPESRCHVLRADGGSSRGWYAPTYHDRQPALSLSLETDGTKTVFATWLGPNAGTLQISSTSIMASSGAADCQVNLVDQSTVSESFVQTVKLSGPQQDLLTVSGLPRSGT